VVLDIGETKATLLIDGRKAARFDVQKEQTLSSLRARELETSEPGKLLVIFDRSSPDARDLLRGLGISYAAGNGELWLHAPPVHVEWPARRRRQTTLATDTAAPFAIRASRISRWLLLHPTENASFREIGAATELSESIVSRTLNMLAEDDLVVVQTDPHDGRRRRVHLRDAGALLDAFERAIAARRVRRQTWEIGASDVPDAIRRLRMASKRLQLPYAIGGLAGASFIRKVVEPVTVDAWVGRDALELWMEELAAYPSRPSLGTVTIHQSPDPFVLSLATRHNDFLLADPVQIYLDCRRVGERALEAADAIRSEMNW
jgi:DNA-binding MarR family transcriptional regulator